MAELQSKIDPKLYEKYVVIDIGKTVLCVSFDHPLYGTLWSSLLFWSKVTGVLVDNGYKINPYNWCVDNREFNGSQCTVLWHVDDLKWSTW